MPQADFRTRVTKGGPNAPVKAAPASVLITGQKTVAAAGTPERLHDSQILEAGVYVKALAGNGGNILILNDPGASSGYVLDAGESVFIEIDDLAKIWLDTDNATDGVSFLAS
jgi:hypothetical protein